MRCLNTPVCLAAASTLALSVSLLAGDDPGSSTDPTQVTPAAKEVIDRAINAMGGAALFDAVQSVSFDCEMENAQGTMLMTVMARNGAGTIMNQSLIPPGGGEPVNHRVLTATMNAGWARDVESGGVRLMPSGVAASIARAGDQWNFLRTAMGQFRMVDHDGPAMFAGRECTRVRCSDPRTAGLQTLTLYFDDETGLPLGQETATAAGSLISGIARIDEWQTVDGMMIPKRIAVEGQTGTSTLTFTRVEFNGVPASAFDMPEDVATLLVASAG
ncbi:MAG: hypothetical protein KF724_06305 [Phycisphaeraceae bacterium]|nr:hypothetical protein [Phycisphaeraceae bacterium]